jgi:hypothetical protein
MTLPPQLKYLPNYVISFAGKALIGIGILFFIGGILAGVTGVWNLILL